MRNYKIGQAENQSSEVSFEVRLSGNGGAHVEILRDGEGVTTIEREALERDSSLPESDDPPDRVWAWLQELLRDSDALEAAIESVPAIDPVLGCLIRSGLSSSAGQITKCYRQHRHRDMWREVLDDVLRCLGEKFRKDGLDVCWSHCKMRSFHGFLVNNDSSAISASMCRAHSANAVGGSCSV